MSRKKKRRLLIALAIAVMLFLGFHFISFKREPTETEKMQAELQAMDDADKANRRNAIAQCQTHIQLSSKFPDKASFDLFNWSSKTLRGGHIAVSGTGELMNGFGVMIPQKFSCEFEDPYKDGADIHTPVKGDYKLLDVQIYPG